MPQSIVTQRALTSWSPEFEAPARRGGAGLAPAGQEDPNQAFAQRLADLKAAGAAARASERIERIPQCCNPPKRSSRGWGAHLVKLVDADDAAVGKHHRTSLQAALACAGARVHAG